MVGSDERAHRAARFGPREPPGEDLSRIISLSDGVFAFALTLLALSLSVPFLGDTSGLSNGQLSGRLAHVLQGDWHAFLGYVFAFAMIGVWWVAHHRTFRYIERYDSRLVWMNMALLLQIAVMPFVLSVYASYSTTQTAVGLFSGIEATTGMTMFLIWWYATDKRRLVDPELDPRLIHYFRERNLIAPAVFLAAIGVSFVSVPGAQYTWVVAIVSQVLLGRYGAS